MGMPTTTSSISFRQPTANDTLAYLDDAQNAENCLFAARYVSHRSWRAEVLSGHGIGGAVSVKTVKANSAALKMLRLPFVTSRRSSGTRLATAGCASSSVTTASDTELFLAD
eukprot:6192372-Pleurochrysis_carterae.AAC.2